MFVEWGRRRDILYREGSEDVWERGRDILCRVGGGDGRKVGGILCKIEVEDRREVGWR